MHSLLGLLLGFSGLAGSFLLGLLLLSVLREELLVFSNVLLGEFPSVLAGLLNNSLSAESLLGDNSLDLGGLVEGLVTSLDLSSDDILADIVLLVEGKGRDDVVSSLGSTHVGLVDVGKAIDLLLALLHDLEEDSANIGSDNAASHGTSLALTSSSGLVERANYN